MKLHQNQKFFDSHIKAYVANASRCPFSVRILDILMNALMLSLVAKPSMRIWLTMDNATSMKDDSNFDDYDDD